MVVLPKFILGALYKKKPLYKIEGLYGRAKKGLGAFLTRYIINT
jgi:hypothetical protein